MIVITGRDTGKSESARAGVNPRRGLRSSGEPESPPGWAKLPAWWNRTLDSQAGTDFSQLHLTSEALRTRPRFWVSFTPISFLDVPPARNILRPPGHTVLPPGLSPSSCRRPSLSTPREGRRLLSLTALKLCHSVCTYHILRFPVT